MKAFSVLIVNNVARGESQSIDSPIVLPSEIFIHLRAAHMPYEPPALSVMSDDALGLGDNERTRRRRRRKHKQSLGTHLCPIWSLHWADKHFQLSNRKTVRVAISLRQTRIQRTNGRVRPAQAIDFCIRCRWFGRFRKSIKIIVMREKRKPFEKKSQNTTAWCADICATWNNRTRSCISTTR